MVFCYLFCQFFVALIIGLSFCLPGLPQMALNSPNFKDAFTPLGLSCVPFYHQIRLDKPLLRAATEFWIPTQHIFQFNGMELCPTLEEFGVIMGELDLDAIILPTLKEDLSDLAHQLLGSSSYGQKIVHA